MSDQKQLEEWEVEDPERRRGTTWLMLIVAAFVILALIGLSQPMILRSAKAAERTEAISNAKQIGLALLEFDQEFGSFPNDETGVMVQAKMKTDLDLSGKSSNAMFRQLIAYGVQSEDIFYCQHLALPTHRPDNRLGKGEALEPGEVGFSYVAGLSSSDNPTLPILCAAMIPGTFAFDDSSLQHKAVVLQVTNSARAYFIREEDGAVPVGEGRLLFDPSNGLWPEGHVIDLRHPESR